MAATNTISEKAHGTAYTLTPLRARVLLRLLSDPSETFGHFGAEKAAARWLAGRGLARIVYHPCADALGARATQGEG